MKNKKNKKQAARQKGTGVFQLHKLIPNIMTIMALSAGLTSIQFAISERWEHAVFAILIAAVLDAMDGAVARLLNATSRFGAQLDSLSDFLNFGVAPAMLLYLWVLEEVGRLGWMAALVFVVACALRLARFNASLEEDPRPVWARRFFVGVPAPGGAGLALLPVIIWFLLPREITDYKFAIPVISLWVLAVAALMVSRAPTFSTKQIRLPVKSVMPILGAIGLLIAALIHAPWPTLSLFLILYAASIPVAYNVYRRKNKQYGDALPVDDLAMDPLAQAIEDDAKTDDEPGRE